MGVMQIRSGDVIMTRGLFDFIVKTIQEIPESPNPKAKAESLVSALTAAYGERSE